jgi:hypothetical protein
MGRADRNSETQKKAEEIRQRRVVEARERRLIDPASVSPGDVSADDMTYQLWRLVFSIRNMIIAWWVVTIVAAVIIFVAISNSDS